VYGHGFGNYFAYFSSPGQDYSVRLERFYLVQRFSTIIIFVSMALVLIITYKQKRKTTFIIGLISCTVLTFAVLFLGLCYFKLSLYIIISNFFIALIRDVSMALALIITYKKKSKIIFISGLIICAILTFGQIGRDLLNREPLGVGIENGQLVPLEEGDWMN
jgi:hypothetical protein